jgi:hypothetical protein
MDFNQLACPKGTYKTKSHPNLLWQSLTYRLILIQPNHPRMPLSFGPDGQLPPGDHAMTLTDLRSSLLVTGVPGDSSWDHDWRLHLVDNLAVLCGHLREVGIAEVYADGSFATDKLRPGDIDGYFLCDYQIFYNEQFPKLIQRDAAWDLRRREPDAHGKRKPLMWHRYRVELFPQFTPPFESLSQAAQDQHGRPILFPEFFRHRLCPVKWCKCVGGCG